MRQQFIGGFAGRKIYIEIFFFRTGQGGGGAKKDVEIPEKCVRSNGNLEMKTGDESISKIPILEYVYKLFY